MLQANDSQLPLALTVGQCATLACIFEATALKPGNVNRAADFEDVTYPDFLVAAALLGPVIDRALSAGTENNSLGNIVRECVRTTQAAVGSNTNLGTILLIAPLAMAPRAEPLRAGVAKVLSQLTADDARQVYEAIRLARPGGMGQTAEADVAGPPPDDLLAAMRLAAERDLVAQQYAEGFRHVFDEVVPWLAAALAAGHSLGQSIVHVHVRMMSEHPDSLIARKCGPAVAAQAAQRAAAVLAAGMPGSENYERVLGDLDFWLRSDYHRRNPGTTADLVAAGLFAALRDGIIKALFRLEGVRDEA